ncbi:lytic transglycosylase domain-containing protein [Nitriliruptor alkaliphilus]|uniref:lytic transglycosylase domain-containing protein n=1 Tax=Nitriliruptor alkaliphilus TaxID=427918 RepID=UPI0006961AF2|nr:lytic transglycosylase domain-containing protein [Nitriliruptor alkaliphilus]
MGRRIVAAATALVVALLIVLVPAMDAEDRWVGPPVLLGLLPPLAVQLLPETERLLAECPEMPIGWLYAVVTVESSWDPRAFSSAGAAGLVQMMPGSWGEAGGAGVAWSRAALPSAAHPVWDPDAHLATAIPWMCDRLRTITAHIAETGKPIDPLDAAAVCHVAGCRRVLASETGLPRPGDAGCGHECARTVATYVARVRAVMGRISSPDGSVRLAGLTDVAGAPARAPGSGGCDLPDPTGTGGCVTATAAHLVAQIDALWEWPWPVSCWGTRPNPASDHPFGRACDLTVGAIGRAPTDGEREAGWAMATWLTAHADALAIRYLVWDGHIWHERHRTWRPYRGAGIYDPTDVTGGHFDHLHVSVRS